MKNFLAAFIFALGLAASGTLVGYGLARSHAASCDCAISGVCDCSSCNCAACQKADCCQK